MNNDNNNTHSIEIQEEGVNSERCNAQYKYDAFISYRHDPAYSHAILLHEGLKNRGYKIIYDEANKKSGNFEKKLDEDLASSRHLIVIISSNDCFKQKKDHNGKDYFLYEIDKAIKQDKVIIPVYFDNLKYEDIKGSIKDLEDSEYNISKFDIYEKIDFHSDNTEGSFEQICNFLKKDNNFFRIEYELHDIRDSIIKNIRNIIIFLSVVIILFLSILLYFQCNGNQTISNVNGKIDSLFNKPIIIFAGGGSVKKFLEGKKVNLEIDNSLYINMASGYSWPLLQEEFNRYKEEKNNPYRFICLSADSINYPFKLDKAKVCGVYLGEDPLKIYIDTCFRNWSKGDNFKENKPINKEKLKKLLSKNSSIYITSENSGTLRRYIEVFKEIDSTLIDLIKSASVFNIKTEPNKNYVILGSQCFKPNSLDNNNSIELSIENNPSKPMYLYFLSYMNEGKIYVIDERIVNFLEKVV